MRYTRVGRYVLLILSTLAPVLSIYMDPGLSACCAGTYYLNPVPASTQEGNTVSLVLTASSAAPITLYQFRFIVRDPASRTFQSRLQNYTTLPGQYQFSMLVVYPSTSFSGSNSLVGQYAASVDEVSPVASPNVASSSFFINIVDSTEKQRTQTVNIQASGYNASESVSVTIRTQTSSTLVFSQTIPASGSGMVATSWKIPRNATIDTYVLTMTGTSTAKSPSDLQRFSVNTATMSIAAINSVKSTYQRTETMMFSFQPTYPDGSVPSTGVGLLTLERPDLVNITLTATYDSIAQTFDANYTTSLTNQTGAWKAILTGHSYSDAYGNISPGTGLTNTLQLTPATLTISVTTNTSLSVGQQLNFNATITYPDGTTLRSGRVGAYLLYGGTPVVNDSVPMVFDTGFGLWIGTYTVKSTDTGGLWSLVVKASDAPTPPNTGTATRAINIQNNPPASFPLYYFGIIAAIIAGLLIAAFLVFRRRKVKYARLKIDLDAVHSEAGRIESQEFFKSVKDQVKKEKEE